MKRPAFTLIELVISIAIIALVVTYLYQSLNVLQSSNDQLIGKDAARAQKSDLRKLFLLDIMQASSLNIAKTDNKNIDLLTLNSRNSLHNIARPTITYLVAKRDNRLIRIEGINYTLPLNRDTIYHVKFDEIRDNVTHFKLYEDGNNSKVLVTLKRTGAAPEIFEILRP